MTLEGQLTPRKLRFVLAELAHREPEKIAKAAGISLRTRRRYLEDPIVQRAIDEEMRRRNRDATIELARGAAEAAAALNDMAAGRAPANAARATAARAVMEFSQRATDTEELADQLAELLDEIERRSPTTARRWYPQ